MSPVKKPTNLFNGVGAANATPKPVAKPATPAVKATIHDGWQTHAPINPEQWFDEDTADTPFKTILETMADKKKTPEPAAETDDALLRFLLTVDGCRIYFKIFHQSPTVKSLNSSNGVNIRMDSSPEIGGTCIYLRGTSKAADNRMCGYEFNNKAEAEAARARYLQALVEMANSVRTNKKISIPLFSYCDIFEI